MPIKSVKIKKFEKQKNANQWVNYTYYHILMNIEMKERGAAEVARLLQGLPPIFFGSLKYDNDYI